MNNYICNIWLTGNNKDKSKISTDFQRRMRGFVYTGTFAKEI